MIMTKTAKRESIDMKPRGVKVSDSLEEAAGSRGRYMIAIPR